MKDSSLYYMIPACVMHDERLEPLDKCLFGFLASVDDRSLENIKKQLQLHRLDIYRALDRLEQAGHITIPAERFEITIQTTNPAVRD